MKRLIIGLVIAAAATLACQGSAADSRLRVYADLDRPVVLAGCEESVIIKVGLAGIPGAWIAERLPLNVCIVLDKSGSMATGSKMDRAKQGAIGIVERLTEADVLSVVVYDTTPRVLVWAQHVRDKEAIIDAISTVWASGNTALYGGVSYGAAEVRRNLSWKYENRIILLSDGLANVGPSSTGDLMLLGRSLTDEDITVTTIGVGLDYNEDLMTALAGESGGNAYFASSARDLPEIFSQEIGEAMRVAARDVIIRIRCADGVRPVGILGRVGEISGEIMSVAIRTLCGDKDKYALFEVRVPAGSAGRSREVAEVEIGYADPATNQRHTDLRKVTLAYEADRRVVDEKMNRQVVKETALTRVSEAKREAVSLADRGDVAAACAVMKQGAFELEKAAKQCDKDKEILGEAANCRSISDVIEANNGLTKGGRKSVVNQAYTQTTQQNYVPDAKQDAK
jgi:Ca-activated chloride channel family protein